MSIVATLTRYDLVIVCDILPLMSETCTILLEYRLWDITRCTTEMCRTMNIISLLLEILSRADSWVVLQCPSNVALRCVL